MSESRAAEVRICDSTRKRIYLSRAAAKRAVRRMHHRVRIYSCEWCGGYHVTKEQR